MKQLSETLYVQEEGRLLIHAHGPEDTRWCLVDTGTGIATKGEYVPSRVIAMFAELEHALRFGEGLEESGRYSEPGRETSLVQS